MDDLLPKFAAWLHTQLTDPWNVFGLLGQIMFTMRFVVQWIHSERAKRSVVPELFWYFSTVGSLAILIYAIHLGNLVFILGQFGIIVYIRNIQLIWRQKKQEPAATIH